MSEIEEQTPEQPQETGKTWQSSNEWMAGVDKASNEMEIEPEGLEQDPSITQPEKETVATNENIPQEVKQSEDDKKEFIVKSWDGKEVPRNLDWFKGYFGIKGNEELSKMITSENAPIFAVIAEKTQNLNNIIQQNGAIRPEFENLKKSVNGYFGEIIEAVNSENPLNAFDKLLTDLNLTPQQKDIVFEKALIDYVNRRDMTPEARAAMDARKELERIKQESNDYKTRLEQMQAQEEQNRFVQENKDVYANSIKNALSSAGINFSENSQEIMINACKEYLNIYPQKEPLTQYQFNEIAKRLAMQANALRVNNAPKPPPNQQKKIIGKSFNGNGGQQKPNGKFETPSQWMEKIG